MKRTNTVATRDLQTYFTEVIDHPWLISPVGLGYTQASWVKSRQLGGPNGTDYVSSVEVTATTEQSLRWLSRDLTKTAKFKAADPDDINGTNYQYYDEFSVRLTTGTIPPPNPPSKYVTVTPGSLGVRVAQTTFHAEGWYQVDYRGLLGTYIGQAYALIAATGNPYEWTETIYYDNDFKRPHIASLGVRTYWDVVAIETPGPLNGLKKVTYTITRAP